MGMGSGNCRDLWTVACDQPVDTLTHILMSPAVFEAGWQYILLQTPFVVHTPAVQQLVMPWLLSKR